MKQGGTADKRLFVPDRNSVFLSGTFLCVSNEKDHFRSIERLILLAGDQADNTSKRDAANAASPSEQSSRGDPSEKEGSIPKMSV